MITSVQRRRFWSAAEKAAIVQETCAPGMSVLLVAPSGDYARTSVCWRGLCSTRSAISSGCSARRHWRNVILHEVLYLASRKRLDDTLRRRFPIRSQWHARTWQHKQPLHHAGGRGRRLHPYAEQLAEITKIIAGLPTCSYRRAHALIL